MRMLITAVAAASALMAATGALAENYVFDKAHTRILFFVNHLGFSEMPGRFHEFDGGFTFDPDNPEASTLEVTIQTASVDMDHDGLNEHLRTDDFFDVANHPTMTFRSTDVEVTGENTGRITGDLTLLGVTRPVVMDVTFNKAGPHPVNDNFIAGFSGTASLSRSDFGMTYLVPAIGDTVDIRLSVEGIRQ
ncbi:MAG: polyisoprenoid-binding protein [Rhodospirillales bacterium]|nr:MAG: polyisoprenoid-binding protein [Rhodospirillales bacterium]